MKSADKEPLTVLEIESINAHGPFNHSHWDGRGVRISNEEGLAGRADFLVKKIRKIILDNFTKKQIQNLTIADIGCYDGWILHQLSDLPFKKLVGIEPRRKNINKGIKIRELLNIKTCVDFKCGSLETLGREQFDIVLCIGVLHHVVSIQSSIKRLDSITRKMLVLDSICMPSKYLTVDFKRDIEMKDIIYKSKKLCGFTGQKYESSYYDGSTAETAVINVPSLETLIMHLDVYGYNPIVVTAKPDDFKNALIKNNRAFEENLVYGIRDSGEKKTQQGNNLEMYEKGLISTLLNSLYIKPLYNNYLLQSQSELPVIARKIYQYIKSPQGDFSKINKYFNHASEKEIVKNFRFNPGDKICFEFGKILMAEKKYLQAIEVFHKITQKINADWRCVYRSFYLLSLIYDKLKDKNKSRYYMRLCAQCHPNFPLIDLVRK